MQSPHLSDAAISATRRGSNLNTLIIAQSLRYWLIATWALLLGLSAGWTGAALWMSCSLLVGLLRGRLEKRIARRFPTSTGAELTAIAALTSAVWAVAPVVAWLQQTPLARLSAVAMLAAGGILVVTQFRHLPRSAALVGSPYMAAAICFVASTWGQPTFWPSVAVALVINSALATNVFFTGVHKAQIEAFQAQQAHLIAELEAARDKANAASEAKSNFLSIISHELRTPMNGVLGAAQLLDGLPMTKAAHHLVGVIRDSGEDLLALLNDVLDFAKIEQERLDLDQEPVDLHALMDRAVALWAPTAADKGIRLTLQADEAAASVVLGDRLRIGQILNNLISNALKFSPDGEVALALSVSPGADDALTVAITVADRGPGIPLHDRDRLFHAFSQLDESATRRHAGAGLGLAISKRLAQLMGGDLTIDADYAPGARFRLEWRTRIATRPCGTPLQAASEISPLSVLVVEDHPVNRQILELWLTAQGHACATARDGQEALDIAAAQQFDLVLMDVNMPVMDGLTAVRHWRRGANPDTPIVMLTASAGAADVAEGLAAGADAYLAKPVDFVSLSNVITETTDKRGMPPRRVRLAG